MARRRNTIAHRFARMRGLPPEEKALMQRIGNLMDSALNNRQASNPFEDSQNRQNRQIYPPTGLLVKTGVSSVKIIWDPTPSNELLRYEVDFTNLTTGVTETKTTFTNEIVYKATAGTYIADVKSVGRDGSSSPIRRVEFGVGEDLMLIEGAKNAPTELGTVVQDNIKLFANYSIYAWGSCVLDKYVLDENNSVVFRLWRADRADAIFGEATLVETITLYPATESGTDLDSTARAGLITRPAGGRAGSFETSQAVMFSPQAVDAGDADKTVTYFLQALNREVENDEVCLSLVLWAGADGVGSAVPGDIFTPEPAYVFPHQNSFHSNGSPNGTYQYNFPYDTRSWCANIEDGYSLIGNRWTVAMWVRFDSLDALKITDGVSEGTPDGGDQIFLSRSTIDRSGGVNYLPNAWRFRLTAANLGGGTYQHQLHYQIWDRLAGDAGGNPVDFADDRTIQYNANVSGGRKEVSALFPWGDSATTTTGKNDSWYFMVICFEGGYYTGPTPKFRLYMNTATHPFTGEPMMALMVPSSDGSTDPIEQDDAGGLTYQYEQFEDSLAVGKYASGIYVGDLNQSFVSSGMQYHQLGVWNTALDSDESGMGWNIGSITALFNEGRGTAIDWRQNTTDYVGTPTPYLDYRQSENLVHLCQFGAVEEPFATKRAGRDTGYHLPGLEGELNWTYDREEQGYEWHQNTHDDPPPDHYHQREIESVWYDNLPQSWNRGTDIYDVLSPTGSNGTTQYDFSYPGQNMA